MGTFNLNISVFYNFQTAFFSKFRLFPDFHQISKFPDFSLQGIYFCHFPCFPCFPESVGTLYKGIISRYSTTYLRIPVPPPPGSDVQRIVSSGRVFLCIHLPGVKRQYPWSRRFCTLSCISNGVAPINPKRPASVLSSVVHQLSMMPSFLMCIIVLAKTHLYLWFSSFLNMYVGKMCPLNCPPIQTLSKSSMLTKFSLFCCVLFQTDKCKKTNNAVLKLYVKNYCRAH